VNHLIVRADATSQIGTGHIMRCLALAQTWRDGGGKVVFVTRCESDVLRNRLSYEGFDLKPLQRVYPHPDDIDCAMSVINGYKTETSNCNLWFVMDGYHFTPEYQKIIRDAGTRLLVIDDMNHLPCYHTDLLLNQNVDAPRLDYRCDDDTILLLGTGYALLRREFLEYRALKREIPEYAKNILVTLGGADPDNMTLKIVQALKEIDIPDLEIRVVVGPSNPHIKSLESALASFSHFMHILQNPKSMPDLMAWADLAITGGGSTCWESAFMGLPSLIVLLAENQVGLVEHLEKQQAVVNVGWFARLTVEQLRSKIDALIRDKNLRRSLSTSASSLVDGHGVSRVINSMIGNLVTLRQVTYDDCSLIWQWSNEKETRQASFSQEEISWDEHVQWLRERLSDSNHRFFIAMNGNQKPLGQIRYVIDGKKATVSFSIAPEYRNRGYGSECLRKAARQLFDETGVDEILAFVKSENSISSRAFQRAGFTKADDAVLHGAKSHKYILKKTEPI
jgi:UDP-2,4-diacetamido-2,4,6-trideoxy-beta-L-altropyranose hydrolase